MAKPYTPLVVSSFKGENDSQPTMEIDDQQGAIVGNLYLRNGKLYRRLGSSNICTSLGSNPVQGLQWCFLPAASPIEYVIGVYQGTVYDFYNAGVVGAPTALTGGGSRFSTTDRIGATVLDNVLYIGDGANPICRFNGTNVVKSGSIKPTSAPTFNAFVGAGVLTGNVAYKITYLDADGHESEPSDASATLAPVAQNVTINVPNDADTDRSGKNVYRAGPTSTEYKLVNSSPLAAGATTYTDSVADASLGRLLVSGNTRFPTCQSLWEHEGRMCGCNSGTDDQTLFVSNELEPWYCPLLPDTNDPTQGVRLKIQARNSELVGGISHGGYCFVFSTEGGYILQGASASDFKLERFTNHGCTSHLTIRSIRDKLFWLGPDGVYQYDGAEVTDISEDIKEFLSGVDASERSIASAFVYQDRYYLSTQDGVRVYDTKYNAWTRQVYPQSWRELVTSSITTAAGHEIRIFSVDGSKGLVVQLEKPATYTDYITSSGSTQGIRAQWRSKIWNMGLQGRDKRVYEWIMRFKAVSPGDTVPLKLNIASGDPAQTVSFSLNNTVGDDAYITPTNPTVCTSKNEASEACRSEFFQLEMDVTSSTIQDLQLLEAQLFWVLCG